MKIKVPTLETARLILRMWSRRDAADLYAYAKNPNVGPNAGWKPHADIRESRMIITQLFQANTTWAITLRGEGRPIGSIGFEEDQYRPNIKSKELGYSLSEEYWGQGIMPEAAQELLRHAFEDCGMSRVWCGHYEGNLKSRRVMEKCGMHFRWKSEGVDVPLMHEKRDGYVFCIEKEEWESQKTK